MSDIRQHPNFHKGFHDAQQGEPLFDDADATYAAGWRAYWTAREIIDGWMANPPGRGSDDAFNIRSSFG